MAKAIKTLNLPVEVVEVLEKEDNQSETVENALRQYYGMVEGGD